MWMERKSKWNESGISKRSMSNENWLHKVGMMEGMSIRNRMERPLRQDENDCQVQRSCKILGCLMKVVYISYMHAYDTAIAATLSASTSL